MSATSADRRDDVVRLLAEAPDGLSDGELARALGDDVRPQTVNALCRRMATAGLVERTGTRPIRNRLVPGADTTAAEAPSGPDDSPPGRHVDPDAEADPGDPPPGQHVDPGAEAGPDDSPARQDDDPGELEAGGTRREEAGPATDGIAERDPIDRSDTPEDVGVSLPGTGSPPARAESAGPDPRRDALQAWSRTVNVQAAVASWLRGRGATIRSATLDGTAPARDLVARLDGADVHVEVTGWPPDGDRTHPTTIAADWFTAAARAAVRRRGDRPHARIVVALPDTRRYRALVARDAALAGARTEVWFVDPTGAVQESS